MSFEAWIVFALFWLVFVTTPGPNAVNCISNGMTLGFRRSLIGVLAILTQATLFLILSALGVTALITASPLAFTAAKLIGAGFLIYLGVRGWLNASKPVPEVTRPARSIYLRAFCHRHDQSQKRGRIPRGIFAVCATGRADLGSDGRDHANRVEPHRP